MGLFGVTSGIASGIMGASLFSAIWGMTHRNDGFDMDNNNVNASVTRFDREQETMSSDGAIPIVYGERMLTGNQTYHHTNAEANILYKHVVFAEGGNEGILTATAAGLNLPGTKLGNAVFSVQNRKYQDATITYSGKHFRLYANGVTKEFDVKNKDDFSENASFWSWQTNVGDLIAYINKIGMGWEAFPLASTSKYSGDITGVQTTGFTPTVVNKSINFNKPQNKGITMAQAKQPSYWGLDSKFHLASTKEIRGETWFRFETSAGGGAHSCYNQPVEFLFDGGFTSGTVKFEFHDGKAAGDKPSNYTETGAYPNMAWADITLPVSSNLNGNPTIEVLLRGRKVLDTRINEWVYSTNPAMCLRDLLLNKTFGGGYFLEADDIDEDSFKEAADWCDHIVSYQMADGTLVSGKRYELNIVIDSSRTLWQWTQDILASFCGFLVITRNKLALKIEKAVPISYSFDESKIKDLSISQTSLEECPNQYRVKFISPENNWKSATAIVDDLGDQRERGRIIVKDVNLEGVTSQSQALRLARFYRDYNKICTLQVSFKTGFQAAHLEPGDVVTLTYKRVVREMPFRITEIKETGTGEYTISGRQYNESIYNDDLGARMTAYNYSAISYNPVGLDAPTNVTAKATHYVDKAGNTKDGAYITWAGHGEISHTYNVYSSADKGKTWDFILNTADTHCDITAKRGSVLRFAVCAVRGERTSDKAISADISIDAADEAPEAPTGLVILVSGQSITASWQKNPESDIRGYKVTHNGIDGGIITMTSYSFVGVNGTNTFSVQAVDYAGNVSEKTEATCVLDLAPGGIHGLQAQYGNGYVLLRWDSTTNADYYMVEGSYNAEVYGTSLLIPNITNGTYTYTVYAVNNCANGEASSTSIEVNDSSSSKTTVIVTKDLLIGGKCSENCEIANGKLVKKE